MQSEQGSFIGIFREEAAEHMQHLHRGLLALQQHPQDETLLQGTSRAADTLLGSAMTMGFEAVSQQARTMRDRLIDAREGASPLDTAALDRLLQELEALCALVDTEVGGVLGDVAAGAPFATVMTLRTSLEALHHNLMPLPAHPRDAAFVQHVCALALTLRQHTEAGGFDAMAQVAQRTEDIIRAAAEGGIHLNQDELGVLLQGLGFIDLLLDAAVTGGEGDVAIGDLCAMLENILSAQTSELVHAVPESQPGPEMPTPSEAASREVIPPEGVKATAKVLIASNSPSI